jgi:hypothetical protein
MQWTFTYLQRKIAICGKLRVASPALLCVAGDVQSAWRGKIMAPAGISGKIIPGW